MGREGGDASGSDAVLLAVPQRAIADAIGSVSGLEGVPVIDAMNVVRGGRPEGFESLSEYVKSLTGGPVAKAFNANFANLYDRLGEAKSRPSMVYAADDGAREVTETADPRCGLRARLGRRPRERARRRGFPRRHLRRRRPERPVLLPHREARRALAAAHGESPSGRRQPRPSRAPSARTWANSVLGRDRNSERLRVGTRASSRRCNAVKRLALIVIVALALPATALAKGPSRAVDRGPRSHDHQDLRRRRQRDAVLAPRGSGRLVRGGLGAVTPAEGTTAGRARPQVHDHLDRPELEQASSGRLSLREAVSGHVHAFRAERSMARR